MCFEKREEEVPVVYDYDEAWEEQKREPILFPGRNKATACLLFKLALLGPKSRNHRNIMISIFAI